MAIDRYGLVSQHNPILETVDRSSPLTVGNGELAFTADVTGLQTLYQEYLDVCPLCTLSQWGWHTEPVGGKGCDAVSCTKQVYTLEDLVMTEFDHNGRKVFYPKDAKPGNEDVYEWLRKNPHRLNLARIGLEYEEKQISEKRLSGIHQELDLYNGILKSSFSLDQVSCRVETACDCDSDTLGIWVESTLLQEGKLSVAIVFPYGASDISASDFESTDRHSTEVLYRDEGVIVLKRILDKDIYYVAIRFSADVDVVMGLHKVSLWTERSSMELSVCFCKELPIQETGAAASPQSVAKQEAMGRTERAEAIGQPGATGKSGAEGQPGVAGRSGTEGQPGAEEEPESVKSPPVSLVWEHSSRYWKDFWEKGAIVQLHNSQDPRAVELERRIILSLYLLAVNSCGSAPPQETGLVCNSWYGKMHLEMHFWHCAWAPLWGRTELLEKSLTWYPEHMEEARGNAMRNGYKGVRWPKMVALDGIDSPSKIAPLLLWQQPHIIFMLELCWRENHNEAFRRKYWPVVKETADFMADIVIYNEEKGCYELAAPVIPVQECHRPEETLNPAFEVSYWKYTLEIALRWAKELGQEYDPKWAEVSIHMASLTDEGGVYLAHEKCHDTYTVYNHDHPSMLMSYGVLPDRRVNQEIMENTLHKVMECWDYPSLWGWDFAVMAMTAVRLGEPDVAVDILMKDTPKNDYVVSGNNCQTLRKDLPLYLPGNGSLLLAVAMMAGGYEGCSLPHPGFPEGWVVEAEGLQGYI